MRRFQNQDVVALAVATLFTVFAWIGFETYRTITTKDIPAETQQLIQPLPSKMREDVLDTIQSWQP